MNRAIAKPDAARAKDALKKYGISIDEGIGAVVLADWENVQQEISLAPRFAKARDSIRTAVAALQRGAKESRYTFVTLENAPAVLDAIVFAYDTLCKQLPDSKTPPRLAAVLSTPKNARILADALRRLLSFRLGLAQLIHSERAAFETASRGETHSFEEARCLLKKTTRILIGDFPTEDLLQLSCHLHTMTWSKIASYRKSTQGNEYRKPGQGRRLALANQRALRILNHSGCKSPPVALAALLFQSGKSRETYANLLRSCTRAWERLRKESEAATSNPPL